MEPLNENGGAEKGRMEVWSPWQNLRSYLDIVRKLFLVLTTQGSNDQPVNMRSVKNLLTGEINRQIAKKTQSEAFSLLTFQESRWIKKEDETSKEKLKASQLFC